MPGVAHAHNPHPTLLLKSRGVEKSKKKKRTRVKIASAIFNSPVKLFACPDQQDQMPQVFYTA
jgi:hypothetical protein